MGIFISEVYISVYLHLGENRHTATIRLFTPNPKTIYTLLPFLVPSESTEIYSPSAGFSARGITLHEDDLRSLQPGAWLNDNVSRMCLSFNMAIK